MRVGDLEILPVLDGVARFPISDPFLGMPPEAWLPHRQFLTSDDELELALGGFVVRSGDRVVLIDCGVGRVDSGAVPGRRLPHQPRPPTASQPADVTDVMFTHLHFDHVGWATQQGDGRVPQRHLPLRRARLGPLRRARSRRHPQAVAARRPHGDVGRVAARCCPASTPWWRPGTRRAARSSWSRSGAERAMLLGDVVHCPVELLDDEWAGMGDVDPELAKRTRNALARELEGTDVPVAAAHFPGLQFGKLLVAQRQAPVGDRVTATRGLRPRGDAS